MRKRRLNRRLFVKQHDETDCGPACLCSVCAFYGVHLALARARQLAGSDLQGTNVYGMVHAATSLGFRAEALAGSREELEKAWETGEIQFPTIVHIVTHHGMEHYVVVLNYEKGKVVVADPAVGKRMLAADDFFCSWTGVVVALSPSDRLEPGLDENSPIRVVARLARHNAATIVATILLSLILTAIGVITAFIFQYIIDDIVMRVYEVDVEVLMSSLAAVCCFAAVLYIVQSALTCVRAYGVARLANRLDVELLLGFCRRLASLPVSFFGTRKTGEILSRFGDAAKIRDAVSSIVLSAIIDSILILAGVVVLFLLSWQLAAVAVALFCSYAIVAMAFSRRLEEGSRALMEGNAQLQSHLKESIDGAETIKVFGREKWVLEKTERRLHGVVRQNLRLSVTVANQEAIVGLLYSLATIVMLWLGANAIIQGALTLGTLITFNALVGFFMEPVERLVGLQPEIQAALVALRRLNDVNDLEPEDLESGRGDLDFTQPILLDSVSFRYGMREQVLSGVGLRIAPGEKIAIVGESGSGKTTLAKLMLALYPPEGGSIDVGGMRMSEVGKRSLRDNVAYLSQNPFLFAGTIAENIVLGKRDVPEGEFQKVCDLCRVTEFVRRMPAGFDTVVEEGGSNLSGGQRQRIALARVLLRNTPVIILDEATSSLDSISEQAVLRGIFELADEATCIFITHRLSAIALCDRVVLMEDGRVVETGDHEELLHGNGDYARYWNARVATGDVDA